MSVRLAPAPIAEEGVAGLMVVEVVVEVVEGVGDMVVVVVVVVERDGDTN